MAANISDNGCSSHLSYLPDSVYLLVSLDRRLLHPENRPSCHRSQRGQCCQAREGSSCTRFDHVVDSRSSGQHHRSPTAHNILFKHRKTISHGIDRVPLPQLVRRYQSQGMWLGLLESFGLICNWRKATGAGGGGYTLLTSVAYPL